MTVNVTELKPLCSRTNNGTPLTYETVKLFPNTIQIKTNNKNNVVMRIEVNRKGNNKMEEKKAEKKKRITQTLKKPIQRGEFVK